MENARFICFTSAFGGCGTTSLAVVFGRTLSRLYGKNVMYVSFDYLSGKNVPAGKMTLPELYEFYRKSDCIDTQILCSMIVQDEYGLKYMTSAELINPLYGERIKSDILLPSLGSLCNIMLLDIPSACGSLRCLSFCEDIVVNFGFRDYGRDLSENYCRLLCEQYELSQIHRFTGVYDEYSFEKGQTDIHGEFAAGVRELVKELKI